jgi:exosome complex exonuclease RRP6
MYEQSEPQPYKPFETTTATFVDTPEALAMMLAELKTAKEIAIDIEHHDNRSYIGLVSLMQISTRDKDWIVDTLQPWRRRLECLNEVFADPSIVKVLHGAYMDIIWLQRDLGLYIVGLFDTFHAARALGYPGASLAYLLTRFINFKAQKQHQLADWRIRPLTDELLEYARADTHFLLFIFDNMRNELVEKSDFSNPEKNKVQDVLTKSKETALQRYEHPIYDAELGLGRPGWHSLIAKTPVQFTPQQFAVFRAVHKWRDEVAREEDDSPLFIMPNHAVFSIGRYMPEDKAALFNAVQHVSHILRARADELVPIIADAKATGMNGPDHYATLQRVANLREAEYAARSEAAAVPAPAPVPVVTAKPATVSVEYDGKALRATTSSFWGALGPMEQRRPMSTLDVNLAVPLPPLTAEIFDDFNGIADSPSPVHEKPTFIPKEDRPEEDERTDIFVVKQLGGRKRKRAEVADDAAASAPRLDPMQDDEIMLEEDPSEIYRREKAERKAVRKAKKGADRAAAAESLKYDEDEPVFDYANAPSVLHAQDKERQERKGKDRKGKKEKKKAAAGFNPFSKTGDAPKGLGRAPAGQKERAGKSKTFSS